VMGERYGLGPGWIQHAEVTFTLWMETNRPCREGVQPPFYPVHGFPWTRLMTGRRTGVLVTMKIRKQAGDATQAAAEDRLQLRLF